MKQLPARIITEGEIVTDWRKEFVISFSSLRDEIDRLNREIAEFKRKNSGRVMPLVNVRNSGIAYDIESTAAVIE